MMTHAQFNDLLVQANRLKQADDRDQARATLLAHVTEIMECPDAFITTLGSFLIAGLLLEDPQATSDDRAQARLLTLHGCDHVLAAIAQGGEGDVLLYMLAKLGKLLDDEAIIVRAYVLHDALVAARSGATLIA